MVIAAPVRPLCDTITSNSRHSTMCYCNDHTTATSEIRWHIGTRQGRTGSTFRAYNCKDGHFLKIFMKTTIPFHFWRQREQEPRWWSKSWLSHMLPEELGRRVSSLKAKSDIHDEIDVHNCGRSHCDATMNPDWFSVHAFRFHSRQREQFD